MLSDIQKRSALAIVNIFETGSLEGDYSNVTLLKGDTGHLTYGRSQTTLASGNLYLLIKAYCETAGSAFSQDFRPYLSRLASPDFTLDDDNSFRLLLQNAASDPVMHQAQDQFFDRVYWNPAVLYSSALGIGSALGTSVVYDSCIQGSWGLMRDLTTVQFGPCSATNEQSWINHYIAVRMDWLANNVNPILHNTVYRMQAFQQLVMAAKWDLSLPLQVRGVTIDEAALQDRTAVVASAQGPSERVLSLVEPPMRGPDVAAIQTAVQNAGFTLSNDGVFGQATEVAVKSFQQARGLKVDGMVGPATRAALGI